MLQKQKLFFATFFAMVRGNTESATYSFKSRDLRFIIIAKTTNERCAIMEGSEMRLISVTCYSRFHDNVTHSALSVWRENVVDKQCAMIDNAT